MAGAASLLLAVGTASLGQPAEAGTGDFSVTDLPAPATGHLRDVRVSGDTAYAVVITSDPDSGTVSRTPSDGSGAWTPITDPGSGADLQAVDLVAADGGTFLTATGAQCSCDYHVVTASTSRDLGQMPTQPVLGHDGAFVSVPGTGLEDASNGTVVDSGAGFYDGGRMWTVHDGELLGRQVGGTETSQAYIGSLCSPGEVLDVRGKWALLDCAGGARLASTTGEWPSLLLGTEPSSWHLGAGMAYQYHADGVQWQVAFTDPLSDVLKTATEVVNLPSHLYPEAADDTSLVTTDANGAHLLTPLFAGPFDTADATPPTTSMSALPPLIDATGAQNGVWPVTTTWTADDPVDSTGHAGLLKVVVGVTTYDPTVYRYVEPQVPTWTYDLPTDQRVCLLVQGEDRYLNYGQPTTQCTFADATAPSALDYRSSLTWDHFHRGARQVPASYSFSASDPGGIASQDVEVARAGLNGRLGAWSRPPRWTGLSAATRSVRTTAPAGGDVCFAHRATDRVGHIGAWGSMEGAARTCQSLPYDDALLARSGSAPQVALRGALGDHATVLRGLHSSLTSPRLRGSQIWIRVREDSGCQITLAGELFSGRTPRRGRSWDWATGGGSDAHLTGRLVITPSGTRTPCIVDAVEVAQPRDSATP